MLAGVRELTAIGPRDAASPAADRAAELIASRFRSSGYDVSLQRFSVPAGTSWRIRVPAGSTANVIADPPGFDPTKPHVVIGAHYDTVPQAPGAEDNASGVMVMLELARLSRIRSPAVPVRFVAFGAEEARVPQGTLYAFGSRHFVESLTAGERRAVVGMVALDRVGVPTASVPVCSGGRGTPVLARQIRSTSAGNATHECTNRASDHVAFEAAAIPAARVGSVRYDAYHSAKDIASVVDPAQLRRSATVVWSWLISLP